MSGFQLRIPTPVEYLSHLIRAFSFGCAAAAAMAIAKIPEETVDCRVPMQFGFFGEVGWSVDGCGFLWVYPGVAVLVAVLPTVARRYKWRINNPQFLGNANEEGPVRDIALLYLDALMGSM
jgi:hypothetical protein